MFWNTKAFTYVKDPRQLYFGMDLCWSKEFSETNSAHV